jgi:phosphoribosyl 1,2-cyclic phosphodiesterase
VKVTFFGTRGSVPVADPEFARFGGNTSCVMLTFENGRVAFLDAGTGLRKAGRHLQARGVEQHDNLFIGLSHTHWDHIQGFPFFAPAFVKGNTFHLYGGSHFSRTIEETLAGQMENPNFPVHLSDMGAAMHFRSLHDNQTVRVGHDQIEVTCGHGNHPQGVFAYRVAHGGKSVVFATDTEHFDIVDPNLLALAKGVDVLIYDAQYTPEEYAGKAGIGGPKTGWGHSTFEAATELAKAAGVKKLVLFHHDPGQSDEAVHDKVRRARELFASTIAAQEGLSIDL